MNTYFPSNPPSANYPLREFAIPHPFPLLYPTYTPPIAYRHLCVVTWGYTLDDLDIGRFFPGQPTFEAIIDFRD